MSLSLVIMAAGAGSRFGGDKPMAEVGPQGQSLFEYSVHDAFKAGFRHVIFVVNDQQDTSEFSSRLEAYGNELKVEFVVQSLEAFVDPASGTQSVITKADSSHDESGKTTRKKPWGTAHAVLVCRQHIHNPFVVINADDYYGQENFKSIGQYLLANRENPKACVLPGYRLDNTLSSSGGVNRGVCIVDADGYIESIREAKNITVNSSGLVSADQLDSSIAINTGSIVSMTFWGFVPALFDILKSEFQSFLKSTPSIVEDEFLLPEIINLAIKAKSLNVKVFETDSKWKGITYAADLPEVSEFVLKLTDAGLYDDFGKL